METTLAERLKEIREHLGLSQDAMGAIGGVKKLTQLNYEKGASSPTADYLAALSRLGVDVLYLVTGERMTSTLNDEERILVNYYRNAPDAIKKAAMGVLLSVGQAPSAPKTSINIEGTPSNIQNITGDHTSQTIHIGKKGSKR